LASKHHSVGELIAEKIKHFPFIKKLSLSWG